MSAKITLTLIAVQVGLSHQGQYFVPLGEGEKVAPSDAGLAGSPPLLYSGFNFDLSQLLGGLAKLPGGTGKLPAGLDLGLPDKDQGSLNRLGPGKIVNKPPPPSDGSKKPDPLVTLDLCYYLGDDVLNSHIKYFDWYDGSLESYKTYVNLLTLEAMKILNRVDESGLEQNNDFALTWQGPWQRSEPEKRYPTQVVQDTIAASDAGCDAVIFLVFNDFSKEQETTGHEFAGYAKGAFCETDQGSGYAAIVDQGFLDDGWVGPQVLSHHLLLMMTSDLYDKSYGNPRLESRNCPAQTSLLYEKFFLGSQWRDECVNDKLKRSAIAYRRCLHD